MLPRTFMKYVEPEPNSGCWLWTGATNNSGYGTAWVGTIKTTRKKVGAHRISYEHFVGSIPENMTIDHRCSIRRCVNPKHLRVLTQRDNMLVSGNTIAAHNMAKMTAPCGHPYDVQWGNTLRCYSCTSQYMRAWRLKRGTSASLAEEAHI